MPSKKHSFLYAVLFAVLVFLAKAVFIGTAPLRGLGLTPWIIDDVFIVMRVARNVALGHGFTYDFVHATTGSPFLWTYLTSINHLVFGLEWAVKSTIIEMAFFGMLSSLLVFLIAKKISGKDSAAWIALLLVTLTGTIFFQAMNGMETSLFTFFIVLSVALSLGIGRTKRWSDLSWAALTGLVIGLACLTRGDGIFILIAIGIIELIGIVKAKGSARRKQFTSLVVLSAVAVACIAVLIIWQYVRTGSPMIGNQVGRRELALALQGFDFHHFQLVPYLKIVTWNCFQLLALLTIALGSWLLGFLALGIGFVVPERKKLACVTTVYCAGFFGALVLYQWYFPDLHGLRYLNPAAHLLFALAGAMLADLWNMKMTSGKVWAALITAMVIVVSQYYFYDEIRQHEWAKGTSFFAHPTAEQEKAGWAAIDWVNANLPKDAVIGVRDHGRFALFTDRPIQDIAGTVDPNVPKLVREGGLKEYLKARNVSYLLLPPPDVRGDAVYKVIFRDLTLTPVKGAPAYGLTKLYKVVW